MKLNQRRRLIRLMAASAVAGVLPFGNRVAGAREEQSFYQWHGVALGAEVSLQLYHREAKVVERLIRKSIQIIREQEALFSLYQADSAISILNRTGVIHHPPAAFTDLLLTATHVSEMTAGAFDITVQPLWQYYKQNEEPEDQKLWDVRTLVDYRKISISPHGISFDRAGMAITLNGIAQGYITDRVSEYLAGEGMTSVLVDMGEYRALGPQADGSPWRIGLVEPRNTDAFSHIVDLGRGALATSSGYGDKFDTSGEYHHLFDPRTGKSSHRYDSVTVMAPDATMADALSTAFYAMPLAPIREYVKENPLVKVRLTNRDGTVIIV